jgi:GntR family transcriptional regulator
VFEVSALAVDLNGPVAVYAQIQNQIRYAIASGRLKEGAALPTVRSVSDTLGVNPNTVTKAYRDLEILELVASRRGVGAHVAKRARKRCKALVQKEVKKFLLVSLANCTAAGIEEQEIYDIIKGTLPS